MILPPGPWSHRYVRSNGARFHLAVGTSFATTRPLVLLLHGFGQFWWAWRHQVPALDSAGYSVAALDLRGHAASDKTPHGYDPVTVAADVAGVVDALGFGAGVLVGHDQGGSAAWSTSAYAPGSVRALVSMAAPHPLAFPGWPAVAQLAWASLPVLPERGLSAVEGPALERRLAGRSPDPPALSAADAEVYAAALREWPSPQRALAYRRRLARTALRPAARNHRQALRRGTSVPVLSLRGEQDRLVPRPAMAAAAGWTSGAHTLIDIPGAGHLLPEEAPAAVNAALLDWLAALDPGSMKPV